MYKYLLALVFLIFTLPSGAHAQSAADLQAQAEALLQKVAQLQAQLIASQNTGQSVTASNTCPKIGRTLKVGSSGDDVKNLQQFLATDPSIYPEGMVTGYYGALTQKAVERWQIKYNIVSSGTPETTGFGVVGPRTAAAIALLCSGVPSGPGPSAPVGGFIQISPVTGNAPLMVNVVANINTTKSCSAATYVLDFGDGSQSQQIPLQGGGCQQLSQTYRHQYTYGGTYQVKLSAGQHMTTAIVTAYGPAAPAPQPTPSPTPTPQPTSAGTYSIVSINPSVNGNPLAVSIQVSLPACPNHSVDWGDGTISPNAASAPACSGGGSSSTVSDSHTYAHGGSYTIKLLNPSAAVQATASIAIEN